VADFELLGASGDETRLLVERATGYSVPLSGKPELAPGVPDTLPRYDTIVTLDDVKVEHGFRLDDVPAADMEPAALAKGLAQAYAMNRTDNPRIKPVPEKLRGGAVAGAHTIYPIAAMPEPTMEHLFLLLRPSPSGFSAVYHTTRFRTDDLNQIYWAHLRSTFLAFHHWDPSTPRTTPPQIFPPSTFALPKGKLVLTDAAWEEAQAKAAEIGPLADEQTAKLVTVLREIVQTDDPPAFELFPVMLELHMRRIAQTGPTRAAEAMIKNLGRCKNALDLRGWAWQCAWAIGNRDDRGPEQRTTN
jgi:hypothetical protein